jgi:hypothetical protein
MTNATMASNPQELEHQIRQRVANQLYEERGREEGHDLDDWPHGREDYGEEGSYRCRLISTHTHADDECPGPDSGLSMSPPRVSQAASPPTNESIPHSCRHFVIFDILWPIYGVVHFALGADGLTGTDVLGNLFEVAFLRVSITPHFNPHLVVRHWRTSWAPSTNS